MVDSAATPPEDEESPLPPGPRRSTYTPPPAGTHYNPAAAAPAAAPASPWAPTASADNDPLAEALAQENRRWVPLDRQAAPSAVPVQPVDSVQARERVDPVEHTPSLQQVETSTPAPPSRVSLTDDALAAAVDPDQVSTDTGTLLDLFEHQLALREQEAAQLNQWEEEVRRSSGDGADELVARVRSAYTGVIDVIPPADSFAAPARVPAADPASLTGSDLDQALADAPPPVGIQPTVATPPDMTDVTVPPPLPAPPPLVAPEPPRPAHPLSGATELEALLAAAHAATGDAPVPFADADTAARAAAHVDADADVDVDADEAPVTHPAAPAPARSEPASIDPAVPASAPIVLPVAAVTSPRAAVVEASALEPTPITQRAGRSVRLFWLWFSVTSSGVTLALGAVLLTLGISLRQAVLAALIGVALSFLPLGLGTVAGKWSGQPTLVVSRSTFGIAGNVVPAALAVFTRLLWAAILLWILATGAADILAGAGLSGGISADVLALIVGGVGLTLASLIAGWGFGLLAVVGAVVAAVSAVLVVGLLILTANRIDVQTALTIGDGPWILLVTGAVLVFSVVGLAWAQSSGDLARYQGKGTRGSSAVLFSSVGATLPAFVLTAWGALLAASDPGLAESLSQNPVAALSTLLPSWYPVPLVLAVTLSLTAAAALALYSGGFAVLALGITAPRWMGVLMTTVLTGALLAVGLLLVADLQTMLRDILTTVAVPVAAWAGIMGAETLLRSRRVHAPSLLTKNGVYPAVRWVNLVMLVVTTAIGWGFTSATLTGVAWQGYLWQLLGAADPLASSDLGVLVAFALGLLTPIVAGIPALRALQAAEERAATADA